MNKPKLIVLNGFAGSGKSTIGKRYIQDHPLSLLIEGDELIVNIGQWLKNEAEARNIIYELTKGLIKTQLEQSHDVILPYLIVNHEHMQVIESIALHSGASYHEFLLHNDRRTAIARLMERGTWGEAGLNPLSDDDMTEIERLYDQMEAALSHRKNSVSLDVSQGIEHTYKLLSDYLREV